MTELQRRRDSLARLAERTSNEPELVAAMQEAPLRVLAEHQLFNAHDRLIVAYSAVPPDYCPPELIGPIGGPSGGGGGGVRRLCCPNPEMHFEVVQDGYVTLEWNGQQIVVPRFTTHIVWRCPLRGFAVC